MDPRGPLRTIHTPHFRVHFRLPQDSLARRVAAHAELAWRSLASELAPPPGKIDLAVADNVDASNGFARVFPTNQVVIFAVPPVTIQELRFQDEWLQLVTIHELAHIFHLDRARGIWRLGRIIFGRNPLFFPNQFTPSWVKEGLAVYYETKFTGSGRNASTEAPLVTRAAAIDDAIPPISRWSIATTRFPQGQTAYAWGASLMRRAAQVGDSMRAAGGDIGRADTTHTAMRRFVDRVAVHPIPFLLNARAEDAFGARFSTIFRRYADSLGVAAAAMDTTGDARWQRVSDHGWYAEAPRWRGNDTLVWAASTGREVAGLYEARIGERPRRVARRNDLDANVPLPGDSTVFVQGDYTDPYTFRYDLYEGEGSAERRRTRGARLAHPDVRADGSVVAVQLQAGTSRLVRVTRGDAITVSPLVSGESRWAEPRWSPDGRFIAAAELLPDGDQRIVVLDTAGRTRAVVAGARAVFASPSFTPDGRRLVWASDRSGRMQLETAAVTGAWIADASAAPDTTGWRDEREAVRRASDVTTGVFQPTISPDGARVAALVYRVDGYHVSVAALDTTGPVARGGWYAQTADVSAAQRESAVAAATRDLVTPARRYAAARQLLPRYWFPEIGTGRDGGATYGLSSSASDILQRHEWLLQGAINPRLTREIDVSGSYRYRGFGQPVLDLSVSQEWDATFRVADTANTVLGDIARRRRFATVSASVSRPRVRFSTSGAFGAQYEWRDFAAEIDSLLGAPGSVLRTGTRYPSLFASGSVSTVRRAGRSIAFEEGLTLSANTSYRWRQDMPSLGSWRGLSTLRAYLPLDLPGYARHVLSARVAGGLADSKTATEFSVGGVSGQSADLLPGLAIGDPARSFPVRGVAPDAQRGTRAVGGSLEYRVPLVMLSDVPGPLTLYADRLSFTLFSDAARAWCPAALARTETPVCESPGTRDGILASAGAELSIDLAVQYDIPYRLRIGGAVPYAAPADIARRGRFYVTLGSYF